MDGVGGIRFQGRHRNQGIAIEAGAIRGVGIDVHELALSVPKLDGRYLQGPPYPLQRKWITHRISIQLEGK